MSTVSDLITDSLRLIGVVADGESATAAEAATALRSLNRMISRWSTENLLIYAIVREEFTLTPSAQSYTLGSGATFNTTRPMRIERATIEDQSTSDTPESPLQILSVDEWASITAKAIESDIPTKIFFSGSYPYETLSLWPVPSAANKLVLYSLKPLSSFSAISDSVSLPNGYEDAIVYNLAVRLAAEYNREPSAYVANEASESIASIKRVNIRPSYLSCDAGVLSRSSFYDIMLGE